MYAIIDIGGHQIWIEPGKFYDVNYIYANPGDVVNLHRVLFLSKSNAFHVGIPCLNNVVVKAKILKHFRGKKLTVFKIKPKKNSRLKKGHRQKLTRLLVQDIIK
uniref:Large ribosomal subunit protein bL21c n=1 Tax=Bostrychia simpliciuscula TaxID=324754 RepID=A0A1Z1M8C4_9FLOR|nr:ribosomal protein L21 [Bostrychia simpliciuscula]ARW62004.1 ribosomal protein L21 [Bostrychia simpliciuscula]